MNGGPLSLTEINTFEIRNDSALQNSCKCALETQHLGLNPDSESDSMGAYLGSST